MDLEAPETPDPTPETPPTAPPAEPEPEAPLTEAELAEVERTIDVEGVKQVDARALKEARKQARELKQKADQYDQVVGYVNQVRPYIDFLQANPTLMTRTHQETQPTPTTTTQPVDPKAETLAKTLDLYTADGKPDVARAQVIRDMVKAEANEQATAQIRPLEESTTRERSQFMYQRALVTKAPDGRAVNQAVLDALWSRTDPKITSTEEGAAGIVAMALGLSLMQGTTQPAPTAPAAPPLHTEPAGSRNTARAPLSALDERIATIRGIDQKTYAERVKGFQSGRPNVLED